MVYIRRSIWHRMKKWTLIATLALCMSAFLSMGQPVYALEASDDQPHNAQSAQDQIQPSVSSTNEALPSKRVAREVASDAVHHTLSETPSNGENRDQNQPTSVSEPSNQSNTSAPGEGATPVSVTSSNTGWVKSEDGTYRYFTQNHEPVHGWQSLDGAWYYFNQAGIMQIGWQQIEGAWYHFSESGALQTGWMKAGSSWYYAYDSGVMATGWIYTDGWYFLTESGSMYTGWLEQDSAWYYFHDNGRMNTNWFYWDGSWYYTYDSGVMATGWIYTDAWYYLSPSSGAALTDWVQFGDDWYYFYPSTAAMAANTWIDEWYLSGSGVLVEDPYLAIANGLYSATRYTIVVDTQNNWVGIYEGPRYNRSEVMRVRCSSGAPGTPTVKGEFSVGSRGYSFGSSTYTCYYYTQFYGDYLFHSVLYYPSGGVRDGRLGYNISHGCVRLAIENAQWIYNNIPSGTKVYVY